jgi:hypothetical protein
MIVVLSSCADSQPTPTMRQIAAEGAPSLDGWTVWSPDERVNDPRAEEGSYVYLVIGDDAVRLPGPTITVDSSIAGNIFGDGSATASWQVTDETHAGLTVVVADVLTYNFTIDDFENEISPVRVELYRLGNEIQSQFIFAADGDAGIAHQASIRATLSNVTTEPTGPWTIEARDE